MATAEATIESIGIAEGVQAWRAERYATVKPLLTDQRLDIFTPAPESSSWDSDPKVHQIMMRMTAGGGSQVLADKEDRVLRRRIMNKFFSGGNLMRVTPLVSEAAEELAAGLADLPQPIDLRTSFSRPLCARTMSELLSVPVEDTASFLKWIDEASAPGARPMAGLRDFMAYAHKLVADRRKNPRDDVLSDVLRSRADGDKLHDKRIVNLLFWMLAMGWQNAAANIDYAIALLLTNPGQHELLKNDPALVPGAAEEVIRLSNSQPSNDGMVVRYAMEDIVVDGTEILAGNVLFLDIWTANRDGSVFADPLAFDITREPNPHIGFGHGVYMCNFSHVARTELRAGLAAVIGTLPRLRLAEPPERLQYTTPSKPSGVVRLPVVF